MFSLRVFLLSLVCLLTTARAAVNITLIVPTKKDVLDGLASEFSTSPVPVGEDGARDTVYVRVIDAGWGGLFAAIREAALFSGLVNVSPEGKVVVPDDRDADRESEAEKWGYERVRVDVAWVGSTWFGSFQANFRMFHALDEFFDAWAAERPGGQITVDFAQGLDFDYRMTIGDNGTPKWYGFPLDVGARLFFYRKDMFREVFGSDAPPTSLTDLEVKARQIKNHYAAQGRNVSGVGVSTKTVDGNTMQDFSTWFIGHGGALSAPNGACGYATPEFKAAFDQHARIYSGPDPLDYGTNSSMGTLMDDFLEGRLAMGIFGSWAYWTFAGNKPEFESAVFADNVGMTAPPAGPVRRSTFFGSSAWGILETSPNKRASFEYLKFFMEPNTPRHATFAGGDLPSYSSMLDLARYSTASPPVIATLRALPYAYPQTFPDRDYARYAGDIEAADVVQRMVNYVHMGVRTTAEAIEWGCVRTAEVIAESDRLRAERFPPAAPVEVVVTESDQVALIASVAGGVAAILILLIVVFFWRKRSQRAHRNIVETYKGHADELEREKKAVMIPFGDIEFGPLVGAGAFGDVYRGELHGTPVAIKKLRVTDAGVADDLRTEATVIARLRHPNVCLFMGTSTDPSDGSLCLVTEYLEHGSVYDMLHNSDVAIDLNLVATFLKGAALGCAYLHSREPPLLHKDLKSLNILADANLVPKICDFGLSDQTKSGGIVSAATQARNGRRGVKAVGTGTGSGAGAKSKTGSIGHGNVLTNGSTGSAAAAAGGGAVSDARARASVVQSLTYASQPLATLSDTTQLLHSAGTTLSGGGGGNLDLPPGSLYWMPPEVARGGPHTMAGDVYAFGITMWELVTRRDPYDGDPPFAVVQQVIGSGRRPEIPADTPTQLAELMRDCWAEDPHSRPTFKQIVTRLNGIFGGGTSSIGGTTQGAVGAAAAPTGEVTLVFTDVRGSTELWEACPAEMRVSLGLHNACARQLIRDHGGYEVKTEGDAFMVAFGNPASAIRWACALQEALVGIEWPEAILSHELASVVKAGSKKTLYAGLRVRIGMHTAKVQAQLDASTRRMDYFGRGVNKSARVSGKAQGGQVIVTEETLAGAGGEDALAKLGLTVSDLGPVHMKGITEPANLFQVQPASLQGRTFQSIGAAATAGGTASHAHPRFATRQNTSESSSGGSVRGAPVGGGGGGVVVDDSTPFEFDGALGRVQALVKKQAWAIDYSEVVLGPLVGHGSFGQVYDGMYRGQRVAVKKLLAHKLSEANLMHFFEEMTILSHVRHPNVVLFLGASVDPPAIVTEFATRGTLEDALASNKRTGALSTAAKVAIARQVAGAMLFLSSAKPPLLHRDLKSANILLGDNNVAKVADFGLTTARRASSTMTSVGTPGFMAPEVLAGDNYASAADVFAFGMLVYELVGELPPFQGLNAIKVGQAVLRGERARLPLTVSSKPEYAGLVALMQSCWQQDPAARPTFADIVERLNAIEATL